MRVEINFSGDSSEAVISSEEVTKAVRKLFVQAEETAKAVQEIRISSAQAAESSREARRMAQSIEQIGQEARKARREVEALRLAGAGGRSGVGVGPFGSGFGRVGVLGAAVGLGTATSGPLAGGAAALGVGALGVIGPLTGAVGVLVASFHGLGKAVAGDRQEFEKLSAPTQQFVQDVRSLIPWLHQLQETARAGLLPGVSKGLHDALNPQTAGEIQQAVRGISGELGKLAAEAGKGLGGPQFQQFLNDTGTHGVTQIDNMGHAVGHLASALLTLDHAGQPLADWLTRVIDDGARFVDEYLKAADASGALGDKLGGAQHELTLIGHLVGALGDAAVHLSDDLTPLGNQIIVDLTHALQDLADWLDKNHDKIVEITTGALSALEAMVRLLAPIVAHFAIALNDVAVAVGGWENAFKIVLSGLLIAQMGKLALAIKGVGTAAATAGGETGVGLLLARLGALGKIGAIAIPITVLVYRKDISKLFSHIPGYNDIATWVDKNIPGAGALDNALGTGPPGFRGKGGKYDYPLASTGKIIGTPYQGTHGKAFNQAGGSDNWESENAVDIAVKVGTPVVAVEDGVIGRQIGSLGSGGRFAGLRLHLLGDSGNEYYYAHLSTILVKAGQRVKKGEPLGMSGSANGVAHLHFAQRSGNPQATISGASIPSGLKPPASGSGQSGGTGSASGAGTGGAGDPFGTPPPFTGDKGANLLPAALRLAAAKALSTPGTADDAATIKAEVKWLRDNISGFSTEDQINAYLELASLLGQLKSLAPKVKKVSLASKAGRISAHGEATGLITALTGDPFAATLAQPQSLASAQQHLAAVRRSLLPEIREIDKDLGDKTLTSAALSVLRAQMAQYKKTITSALNDVKAAIARQKDAFKAAWQKMGDDMIAALEQKRSNYKSPARILLDELTAAHDTKALNDALDQANADLAAALKGHQADAQQQLDDIRKYVGTAFLTNALDAAQSAILGGDSVQLSGAEILAKLQGILAGGNVVDPEEVKRAQQAVEDAKYAIQVAGLEKTAKLQEDAYNAEIDAQEFLIRQMQDNWEKYFRTLHGDISKAKQAWIDFFRSIGLTPGGAGANDSSDPFFQGTPGSRLIHGSVGGTAIGRIGIPGFARGGSFVTTGPTPIMVGEGGVPEHVQVTPLGGGSVGAETHVHIHGNIPHDWIGVEIERNNSRISRAQGISADVRRRAGLV